MVIGGKLLFACLSFSAGVARFVSAHFSLLYTRVHLSFLFGRVCISAVRVCVCVYVSSFFSLHVFVISFKKIKKYVLPRHRPGVF